jgi:hypothetical protein
MKAIYPAKAIVCAIGLLAILVCAAGGCAENNAGSSADDDHQQVDDDTGPADDDLDDDAADDDADDDLVDDDTGDDDDTIGGEYAPPPSDDIGVFVSADTGSDDNPGTMAAPKKTIGAALPLAQQNGKAVFVAAGRYEEPVTATVSVFGGYRAEDWSRDIDAFRSIVAPPFQKSFIVGNGANGGPAIVEGMEIHGSGDYNSEMYGPAAVSAAVVVTSVNAILSRNYLTGGTAVDVGGFAGAVSSGVLVTKAGSLLLMKNDLRGGTAYGILAAESDGLTIFDDHHQVTASHNQIRNGPATTGLGYVGVSGVYAEGLPQVSSLVLIANEIHADAAQDPANILYAAAICSLSEGSLVAVNNFFSATDVGGSIDAAVVLSYGPAVLVQNTIVTRAEAKTRGAYFYRRATLVDNLFSLSGGAGSAIVEFASGVVGFRFMANDFYADQAGIALVRSDTMTVTDLDELNGCDWTGCAQAEGNIGEAPLFVAADDFHLRGDSPCIDRGVDPSPWYDGEEAGYDIDGDARPQGEGWDIGADEFTSAE